APGLENPGASITPADVAEAMTWDGVIGLGEMMNFPGVFNNDQNMLAEMAATMRANKTVGGHYASLDLGRPFHAYIAGGAADDHETTREIDGVERARRGMKNMMRLGSAWYDVEAQITAITEKGLDPRNYILCTDDVNAETLVTEGHMDRVLRHAVDLGCDPLVAIQMMTLNTAQHFGVDRDLGSLAPGRFADIVLTEHLDDFVAQTVIANGELVAENGTLLVDLPAYEHDAKFKQSIHLGRPLTPTDFLLDADGTADGTTVTANVIGVIENQAPTRHLTASLTVENGSIQPDLQNDVLRIALVERHKGTSGVINGFVSGFGFVGQMAMASTVAHDSHHMIVVGTSEANMAAAANKLAEVGGGVVVMRNGEPLALVELPIAGLMSNKRADIVAEEAGQMLKAMQDCGCQLNNAYMQLSLLALVVIPELRISDMGLVDVTTFSHVPVIAE
ncbi:MAG: adenine deaminase C-terminal domain-containing protein, partial [Chloroflexota bacterium]